MTTVKKTQAKNNFWFLQEVWNGKKEHIYKWSFRLPLNCHTGGRNSSPFPTSSAAFLCISQICPFRCIYNNLACSRFSFTGSPQQWLSLLKIKQTKNQKGNDFSSVWHKEIVLISTEHQQLLWVTIQNYFHCVMAFFNNCSVLFNNKGCSLKMSEPSEWSE